MDAKPRTLPGLDMLVVLTRKGRDPRRKMWEPAQVVHGRRQLVP